MEEKGKVYAGRYEIVEEVGRGGMAVVYRAVDTRMKRTVALKVLYPFLAMKEENKLRFQREAQVIANMDHRNVVKIFDYSGMEGDENFIVTEFIEGTTLKRFIADHPMEVPEIGAMVVHEIASALDHAHRNGVVHRDVKPENVMIGRDGTVKLMDFGIAQIKDMQQMTVTGTMIGSPAHMSPEHIEGRKLDHRADIFSLGTVLYTLCVGTLPFRADSAHALFKQILDVNYIPAVQANPAVGNKLSAIIDRCLKRDPDERYQSCAELQHDLGEHLGEFGLEDCPRQLALYFNNPRLFQERLKDKVVAVVLDKARAGLKRGRLGEALSLFDRALALDPKREEILKELERVRRNAERKRVLVRYILPLVLIAALSGGAWVLVSNGILLWGRSEEERAARMDGSGGVEGAGAGVASAATVPREDASEGGDTIFGKTGSRDLLTVAVALQGAGPPREEEPTDLNTGTAGSSPPGEDNDAGTRTGVPAGLPEGFDREVVVKRPFAQSDDASTQMGAEISQARSRGPRVVDTTSELRKMGRALAALPSALKSIRSRIPSEWENASPSRARRGEAEDSLDGARGPKSLGKADSPARSDRGTRNAPVSGGPKGGGKEQTRGQSLVPVDILAFPPAAQIYIDDKLIGAGNVRGIMLAPGPHKLRLHHPACQACADTITFFDVKEGAKSLSLKEKIKFKPAELRVIARNSGLVFVDGKLVGRTNEILKIRARSDKPWSVTVKVLFDEKGVPPYDGTAILHAGRTASLRVNGTHPHDPAAPKHPVESH